VADRIVILTIRRGSIVDSGAQSKWKAGPRGSAFRGLGLSGRQVSTGSYNSGVKPASESYVIDA
jgi:hypothetical protein